MMVMILRLSVMVWLLSYSTAAFGSNGPGLAFSREAEAPRMEVGIRLAPVQLKTDLELNENTPVDWFDGVFVSMDPGTEPIPVVSVQNTGSSDCSTAAEPGQNGYCSVDSSGFCSVENFGNSDCSVGGTGVAATNCSVKAAGQCSVSALVGGKFCSSTTAQNNNGVCSVTASGSASCSVIAGNSTCSAEGSSGATQNAQCSVGPITSTNTVRCSLDNNAGSLGKCSAFGSGAGVRFCSVVEVAGTNNSSCTTGNVGQGTRCSVHNANGDPNTKCSVLRPSGNVDPPNGSGQCTP